MYTVSFMLGDSLDDVGRLMLDDDITELVNNYNSSIFSKDQNTDKIKYIKDNIRDERSKEQPDEDKIKKYEELLDKAISAEEIRILGKILKINQGLPTNTSDTYRYIKSIEKFIELQYNKELQNAVDESLSDLLDAINNSNDKKIIRELSKSYKQAKSRRDSHWESFDLIKFILDPAYKQEQINKYELYKTNFNILEVIAEVPHFREMFNVLALNKQILNSLSTRNRLEDIVLNQVIHSSRTENGERKPDKTNISKVLDKEEIRELKDLVDKHLINSWIISKNLSITVPANAYGNVAPEILRLNTIENIDKFRKYVEDYAIPTLKEKLPNNRFIALLTFGLRQNIPFYKLPFNMVQIDNTQKTRSLYEEALYAFNNLKTIKVEGVDMNLVDMFYLYNLIINQDKFGPNSLTRIFEDLISAAGNEKLLVYDFNSWIDKQDIQKLIDTFPLPNIKLSESAPILEDNSIGFETQPTETDLEEAAVEEGTTLEDQDFATEWSKKNGWSTEYFNEKVRPRLGEAWQLEYVLSEDRLSPVQFENSMLSKYNNNQRAGMLANTALDAIRLEEKTANTVYESNGEVDYWKKAKVGDRIKFKADDNFVVVEVTKPLTKLAPNSQRNLSINYYNTTPSIKSKLIALVKASNMKGLHLVYDADLIGEDPIIRNAKGFVRNGEIYINADRATDDTVIHEFGHLYLADAKLQRPDEYYRLLEKVRDTQFWKMMRALPEYTNKRGSDFDEEVLATLIDRSYNDGLGGVNHDIVLEALDLVSQDYKDFLKSDILPVLSDVFIDNYKEQQKLATIKNKLFKDNIIKEDCK